MNHSERDDTHLTRTMKALAEIEASVETPARVEAAVMARWDASRGSGTKADLSRRSNAKADRSRTSRVVRGTMTAAAGVTLVGALVWQQRGANETAGVPTGPGYTTVAVVGGPLMAGEPIRVVRMRVERSVLGELGIPSPASHEAAHVETVDIEVLVGEDGVARGVRVPITEL
jgi:hypothetical protein